MKKYRITSVPTKHGAFIRGRIDKSRRRAEAVGMVYLFALIALGALTCLTLLKADIAATTVKRAFDVLFAHDFKTVTSKLTFITAAFYVFTLLFVAINILRALTYLKNLFKTKVSRIYGLNANIDAMESLGKIFSASFACIAINHFLIYILCDSAAKLTGLGYVVTGLGLAVHFICGFIGGKVSVFYIDDESGVSECKRPYGRIIPLLRNILQFGAIGVIGYLFIEYTVLYDMLLVWLSTGLDSFSSVSDGIVPIVCEGLLLLCFMGLVGHAVDTSEYSVEGPYAIGVRNFRIYSVLTFLIAMVSFLCEYSIGETILASAEPVQFVVETGIDKITLIIAGIGFVMTIFDIILKLRWTNDAIAESEKENRPIIPNISVTTPKQPINIQIPQQQLPVINVHTPAQKPVELPPININMPAAQTQKPTPINVSLPKAAPQQKPAPITVNMPARAPQQKPMPINVSIPAAQVQKPTPINVSMPKTQPMTTAPISIMMPKAAPQQKPMPINVNMPAAAPQQRPMPINVNMPAAAPQQRPMPITVNMPAAAAQQRPMPINVNMPMMAAQQRPMPINVNMPMMAAQQRPMPIAANMPMAPMQSMMPTINVMVPTPAPQQAAPINVMVPVSAPQPATPINVMLPVQEKAEQAPVNVMLPVQEKAEQAPVNVMLPVQEKAEQAPVNVMLPVQEKVEQAPVNVMLPVQEKVEQAPVNVMLPVQEKAEQAPVNVMLPVQEKAKQAPVNVMLPAQAKAEQAPVNVMLPAQAKAEQAPVNVMLSATSAQQPANVTLPVANQVPIHINMAQAGAMPVNVVADAVPQGFIDINIPAPEINVQMPDNGPAPQPIPWMPPLLTTNPLMQPYPMHMNMPMMPQVPPTQNFYGVPVMPEEPAPVKEEAPVAEPIVEEPVVEEPVVEEPVIAEAKLTEGPLDTEVMAVVVAPQETEEERQERLDAEFLAREWMIACPTCSKPLKTASGSRFHRCPACDNVFGLERREREVPGSAPEEAAEETPAEETSENE